MSVSNFEIQEDYICLFGSPVRFTVLNIEAHGVVLCRSFKGEIFRMYPNEIYIRKCFKLKK